MLFLLRTRLFVRMGRTSNEGKFNLTIQQRIESTAAFRFNSDITNNFEGRVMKRNLTMQLFCYRFFVTLPIYALDGGVESLKQTSKAFASVAKSVSPSVAFIQVESKASDSTITQFSSPFGDEWPFSDDLFKRFLAMNFLAFHAGRALTHHKVNAKP